MLGWFAAPSVDRPQRSNELPISHGTESLNPFPSSEESGANSTPLHQAIIARVFALFPFARATPGSSIWTPSSFRIIPARGCWGGGLRDPWAKAGLPPQLRCE